MHIVPVLKEATKYSTDKEMCSLYYFICWRPEIINILLHWNVFVYSCKMTHASLTDEERQSTGIHDNLIRLSIGLEYYQDLIDDLEQAIQASGAEDKC